MLVSVLDRTNILTDTEMSADSGGISGCLLVMEP